MRGPWSWWRERQARKRETETLLRIMALLQEHERDLRMSSSVCMEVYYDALLMQCWRDEPPPERETSA